MRLNKISKINTASFDNFLWSDTELEDFTDNTNIILGWNGTGKTVISRILRSFEKNEPVVIRNPKATRPWQHVLEPLSGYLVLVQKMYNNQNKYAEAWNFGPNEQDVKPVDWVLDKMILDLSKWLSPDTLAELYPTEEDKGTTTWYASYKKRTETKKYEYSKYAPQG